MHKEKILILFDGPHLAFSPTTIQLYDALSVQYDVTIIAQNAKDFNGQQLNDRKVVYHKYYNVLGRKFYLTFFILLSFINPLIKKFKIEKLTYRDYFFKFLFIKQVLKKNSFKRIICIDITNLFFCSLLNKKVDFLSLELCKNEHLLFEINFNLINCVIIQSIERFKYLFKQAGLTVFFVQNSPNFKEVEIKPVRKGLIYAGGAYNVLGFYHCLDFLRKYKQQSLTVQGAVLEEDRIRIDKNYKDLLDEGRLIINAGYIDNENMVEYLSNYEIGFCFYNFDDPFIKKNYFNYASAPSGKMFKYIAAGVPVVCSNIPGFKFVKEFSCGILIDNLSPESIEKAVIGIRNDYDTYVSNSIKAARTFSFDKAILPYLRFIDRG